MRLQVYVLPDNYEVTDPSLRDIKYLLSPSFTPEILQVLDLGLKPSVDLTTKSYIPGSIGLNNIKDNSYMNVILQALMHIPSLRDYFIFRSQIQPDSSPSIFEKLGRSELVCRLGELYRKYWNPRLFKAQVSPHEFLQEVGVASGRRFVLTEAGDPLEFLSWLLNSLHRDLGGSKKPNSSVIHSAFQGGLKMEDQVVTITDGNERAKPQFDIGGGTLL